MPAALKADWEAIRALHAAGVEFKELAQKFQVKEGTIRRKADRRKWKDDKLPSVALSPHSTGNERELSLVSKRVLTIAESLLTQKERFLQSGATVSSVGMARLAKMIDGMDQLTDEQSKRLLGEISAISGELMKTAKPVFGLDNSPQVQVNIGANILSELPATDVFDSM